MKKYYDPEMNQVEFDSKEELEFFYWLNELKTAGLIETIVYHPEPFVLCESFKVDFTENYKLKLKTIIQKKTYTADFFIKVKDSFKELFPEIFLIKNNCVWVDVKGNQTNGKFVNSSAYTFPVKQAWVYAKYNIFVQKVVSRPKKVKGEIKEKGLFLSTFVPLKVLYLQSRKEKTISKDFDNKFTKTLTEILNDQINKQRIS